MTDPRPMAPAPGGPEPAFRGGRPAELRFGTSGLRGLVREMTDLEVYVNTRGFLGYLRAAGEAPLGSPVAIGEDLRAIDPGSGLESTPRIARAVARAVRDEGLVPLPCGPLPTPALAYYATGGGSAPEHPPMPAIMVTGSHIPPDRNGVKFYRSAGEVLKGEETAILAQVGRARRLEYGRPASESPFDDAGALRAPEPTLAPEPTALARYRSRYLAPWAGARPLAGMRVVVWQHSAVGRDLLVELLATLGAEPVAVDRTTEFVAVDTEDLDAATVERLRRLAATHRPHAVVSTDGDSDRPLLADESGQFWPGDVVGIVTAETLGASFAAVPVTTTDALERRIAARRLAGAEGALEVERTRVGSPHVIAAMQRAIALGHPRVVGWEANGGFLTGSALPWGEGSLSPLPTRDAMLPLLCCLCASARRGCAVSALFRELPVRRSRAGLVDAVPPERSRAALERLRPSDPERLELHFATEGPLGERSDDEDEAAALRSRIARYFDALPELGRVHWLNIVDGLRVGFASGDVVHLRPSGNAPQFRIYALSDSSERAERIVQVGLRERDGIIARLVADEARADR